MKTPERRNKMRDPYEVLGIPPTASDEEVKTAYRNLARRYHPDHFVGDDAKKDAEAKMQEINEAYSAIAHERSRRAGTGGGSTGTVWEEIRDLLNQKRYADAESRLDAMDLAARPAEWHYLKSIVLMRRGWANDALREVDIACAMDPQNTEYQNAKVSFENRAASFGGKYRDQNGVLPRTTGGCTTCDMCTGLICADCLCESCGFDLIRCI